MTPSPYLKHGIVLITVLLLAVISVIAVSIGKQSTDADALWKIVHRRCVPDMQTKHNLAPCVRVNLSHGEVSGFETLKDAKGDTHYLIIPTARITGIESPALLTPKCEQLLRGSLDSDRIGGPTAKSYVGAHRFRDCCQFR